jgi:hypothetical protein
MNYGKEQLLKGMRYQYSCAVLNKEYVKDYKKYYSLKILKDCILNPFQDKEFNIKAQKDFLDNFNKDFSKLDGEIVVKEKYLKTTYSHLYPINPLKEPTETDTILFNNQNVFIDAFGVMQRAFLIDGKHLAKGILYMPSINLKLPMCLIMSVIEEWVRTWKKEYIKLQPEHKETRNRTPERLALKIFKLKQEGKKHKEIAEKFKITTNKSIKLSSIGYRLVYGKKYKPEKAFIKRKDDLVEMCSKCSKVKMCKKPCEEYEKLSNKGLMFDPKNIPIGNWHMSTDEAYYALLMNKKGRQTKKREATDVQDNYPY